MKELLIASKNMAYGHYLRATDPVKEAYWYEQHMLFAGLLAKRYL